MTKRITEESSGGLHRSLFINFKTVSISKRLYAFSIDLAVVSFIKILLLKSLSTYLHSILSSIGNHSAKQNLETELTFFVFTLFPLIWIGYHCVSTYIFKTTIGSKIFGYHFEQIMDGHRLDLTFAQSLQRSLILLTCIYTWGVIALIMLFRKDKNKVITDLVENVSAILNENEFNAEVRLLTIANVDEKKAA